MRRLIERVSVKFEFVPRDLWVGLYWKTCREREWPVEGYREVRRLDVFVCLLPCLPVHVSVWTRPGPARLPSLATAPALPVKVLLDRQPAPGEVMAFAIATLK